MIEAALPEDLEQRIVVIGPIALAVGHRHVERRSMPAPKEIRQVGGGQDQVSAKEMHTARGGETRAATTGSRRSDAGRGGVGGGLECANECIDCRRPGAD